MMNKKDEVYKHHCSLLCSRCKRELPIEKQALCPYCGGILTVKYPKDYLKKAIEHMEHGHSMWDYGAVLPPIKKENIVTLQEGETPLYKSKKLGKELGITALYFKDETKNPTGSFKDRPVSVCVSMAKEFGCKGVVVASSGNGGAATAAYGAMGDIENYIFVPEATPTGKVAQALAYGGNVVKVEGDFTNSYQAAKELANDQRYMNITTTFLNPYGIEGDKTIAYELLWQLKKVPHCIIIPVGAGPILYGIYKGFLELLEGEKIETMPKLVCVQAKGCSPIATAFLSGQKVKGEQAPHTVASAICDPLLGYEQDGDLTVEAIANSKGSAVIVTDEEILEAGRLLANREGLFVEPASAAVVAGVKKLKSSGWLGQDECVVCLLTGSGLKDSLAYLKKEGEK